ncbi:MAG: hypothetical protein EBS95_11850 [Chitinophagia bacterium]|nr:hypothetical protein [Chitinophagia bacterium]
MAWKNTSMCFLILVRRILCNVLANDMKDGIIPNDEKWIGGMIANICYSNAKDYLGL